MTGYEEFQKIMAEINYKIKTQENSSNNSFDFNDLFNMFKR